MGLTTRVVGVHVHLRIVGLAAIMVGMQSRSGSVNQNCGSTPLKSGSDNQNGGSALEKSGSCGWNGGSAI